jgi:UDP-glucose 6-dehydrogenase
LKNKNLKITVYDPINLANEETRKVFGNKLNYAKNLSEATKNKLIILMLPYEEFKKVKKLKNKIIIDLWRM